MHPEKCAIFTICGVVDFTAAERFAAAPYTGNTINIIVNAVFNALDFKAIQAAIIGDTFPAFAIFPFIYDCKPPL